MTPLRLLRLVTIIRLFPLFDKIKVDLRAYAWWLTVFGYCFFCFLAGHLAVCSWVFLTLVIEENFEYNWQVYI
jgi:hypothetical protein